MSPFGAVSSVRSHGSSEWWGGCHPIAPRRSPLPPATAALCSRSWRRCWSSPPTTPRSASPLERCWLGCTSAVRPVGALRCSLSSNSQSEAASPSSCSTMAAVRLVNGSAISRSQKASSWGPALATRLPEQLAHQFSRNAVGLGGHAISPARHAGQQRKSCQLRFPARHTGPGHASDGPTRDQIVSSSG